MEIDVNFDPKDYEATCPISADLWVELNGKEGVPTTTNKKFYTPAQNAKRGWNEKLKYRYDLEENIYYDPKITGLVNEITPQMYCEYLEKHNETMLLFKREPIIDHSEIDPQKVLDFMLWGLKGKISAQNMIKMGFIEKEVREIELTDFEKRLYEWRPDYGYLSSQNNGSFPVSPSNPENLKYEIVREYLFQIAEFSDVSLSLSQEPNTDRAIWGLRRSLRLDWPFDSPSNGRISREVDSFMDKMNNLIKNLEYIIVT